MYDLSGKEIALLANGIVYPGNHLIRWEGTDHAGIQVSSGMYVFVAEYNGIVRSQKLVLMK